MRDLLHRRVFFLFSRFQAQGLITRTRVTHVQQRRYARAKSRLIRWVERERERDTAAEQGMFLINFYFVWRFVSLILCPWTKMYFIDLFFIHRRICHCFVCCHWNNQNTRLSPVDHQLNSRTWRELVTVLTFPRSFYLTLEIVKGQRSAASGIVRLDVQPWFVGRSLCFTLSALTSDQRCGVCVCVCAALKLHNVIIMMGGKWQLSVCVCVC